jgi:hypothetical protein
MTSQTSRTTGGRRAAVGAVASGALAAGLMVGMGLANAEPVAPADPTTGADAPPPMTADQVLAIITTEYDTGAGGGQLSNLVHQVMKLRSQGFYPSKGNRDDIVAALDKRPNQEPLIAALQATLAFQTRNKMRGQTQQPAPATIGINQYDPTNPGALGGFGINPGGGAPGGGINIPLGP